MTGPPGDDPDDPGAPVAAGGADLAREALAAARRQNAERREAAQAAARGARHRSGSGSAGGAQDAIAGRGNPKGRRTGGAAALRRRRWSGAGADPRDPAPLGATLRRWVGQHGNAEELTKATVFGRWAEIVGPDVAGHCRPVSLVDGELLLQAESTAWATQIRMLGPQIATRINRELAGRVVLRVRAQGPSGPSWKFGLRHVPGRGPRDTYG